MKPVYSCDAKQYLFKREKTEVSDILALVLKYTSFYEFKNIIFNIIYFSLIVLFISI